MKYGCSNKELTFGQKYRQSWEKGNERQLERNLPKHRRLGTGTIFVRKQGSVLIGFKNHPNKSPQPNCKKPTNLENEEKNRSKSAPMLRARKFYC